MAVVSGLGDGVELADTGEAKHAGGEKQGAAEGVDGADADVVGEHPAPGDAGQAGRLPHHVVEGEDPAPEPVGNDRLDGRLVGDVADARADPVEGSG